MTPKQMLQQLAQQVLLEQHGLLLRQRNKSMTVMGHVMPIGLLLAAVCWYLLLTLQQENAACSCIDLCVCVRGCASSLIGDARDQGSAELSLCLSRK